MSDSVDPGYEPTCHRHRIITSSMTSSGSEPESKRPGGIDEVTLSSAKTAADERSERAKERYSHPDYRSAKSRRQKSRSGSRSNIQSTRNLVDRSPSPRRARRTSPVRQRHFDRVVNSAYPSSKRRHSSMSGSRSRSPAPKRRNRSPSYSSPSPPRRRRYSGDESANSGKRSKDVPRQRRDSSDRPKSPLRQPRSRHRSPSSSPPRRRRDSDVSLGHALRRRRSPDRSISPSRRRRDGSRSWSPLRRDRGRDGPPNPFTRERDSQDPIPRKRPYSLSRSRSPVRRSGPLRDQVAAFKAEVDKRRGRPNRSDDEPVEKQKPNFNTTGLLAKESNKVEGTKVVLKYHEPPEARKPSSSHQWRLYIFKGEDVVQTLVLSRQTCWLIGREAAVVDILAEHPSTSGQHAVVQFRAVKKKAKGEFGEEIKKEVVRPYLIDLESSNGTFLNGERLDQARYVEIRDKDVMKLGSSTREYVFMLPPKG